VKLPKGFTASGIRSGVRKKRPDLALFVADRPAVAAAVFTRNRFAAAPCLLSKQALRKSGGLVRAAVVNAGCANAVTGPAGVAAARRVRRRAAELIGCPEEQIFLASTGVIGELLPDAKIRSALPDAVARLSEGGVEAASHAILTTDVGPKVVQAGFVWNGRRARIVGVAKGAGMIHPNMATMLGFIMTDIAAEPAALQQALRKAVSLTFNTISVDGDTSTNDSVLLMASGAVGGDPFGSSSDDATFVEALTEVCRKLAWMIVRDGEGAIRVMEVKVETARNEREAKLAAHAVSTSPLVKTALHGGDPNWGRIVAALGRSGARFSTRRVSIALGGVPLLVDGTAVAYREKDVAKLLAREHVTLVVALGAGRSSTAMLTCDFGHDYVTLNSDYRS
jgi:glutamate N-acetyltransferase / amino-acid N-acetyltransferase